MWVLAPPLSPTSKHRSFVRVPVLRPLQPQGTGQQSVQHSGLPTQTDCCSFVVQYLCNGLEDDIADRHREMGASGDTELGRMVNASGKMVLLHKLLPKLRSEGRKVGTPVNPQSWVAGDAVAAFPMLKNAKPVIRA